MNFPMSIGGFPQAEIHGTTLKDEKMLTDPIADMLTRIRNANRAMHDSASMPTRG